MLRPCLGTPSAPLRRSVIPKRVQSNRLVAESAVILTVGDEIVSGDVENTNASWLAQRLGELGVEVKLLAAVRDDIQAIATFLRAERDLATHVL